MSAKPRIGVSACLLGKQVRFNGDHKKNDWIVDALAKHADLVGFCPEVSMGLGTPRPALRFVDTAAGVRLVESRSSKDLTALAEATASALVAHAQGLDGFILKKDSPSCGLERVKVYGKGGMPARSGAGIFAAKLKASFPLLPIIEEGRLTDPAQRENFALRIFAYQEIQELVRMKPELAMRDLQRFHRDYKLILLEHSPSRYGTLGKLVGNAANLRPQEVLQAYAPAFMGALRNLPTAGTRVNVLQHVAGYLRGSADSRERAQISETIAEFAQGRLPFIAPLTLLLHEVRKFGISYLLGQKFFAPFPRELGALSRL